MLSVVESTFGIEFVVKIGAIDLERNLVLSGPIPDLEGIFWSNNLRVLKAWNLEVRLCQRDVLL